MSVNDDMVQKIVLFELLSICIFFCLVNSTWISQKSISTNVKNRQSYSDVFTIHW